MIIHISAHGFLNKDEELYISEVPDYFEFTFLKATTIDGPDSTITYYHATEGDDDVKDYGMVLLNGDGAINFEDELEVTNNKDESATVLIFPTGYTTVKNEIVKDDLTDSLRQEPGHWVELDKTEITLNSIKEILRCIRDNPLLKELKFEREMKGYLKREDWAATYEFNKIQFERNGLVYERSISFLYPEIASQWHYEKNHPLVPDQFTPGSRKKVWWKNHSGQEWQADVLSRTRVEKARKERKQNQYDLF